MNKEEFNQLNVDEKVVYINAELEKGLIRATIYNNIGIAKSTIQGQLGKAYNFDKTLNRFIPKEVCDKSETTVTQGERAIADINNILDIQQDLKASIVNLAEEYNTIKKMISWYEKNIDDKVMTGVIEVKTGIKIELEGTETTRTTIRVNENTWNKFKEFSEQNKEYKQQDLLSMALEEFINKYN